MRAILLLCCLAAAVVAEEGVVTCTATWEGVVQGVGFRAFVKAAADRHGVHGWVENRPSGEVVARLQGARDAIGGVLGASYDGPVGSAVRRLTVVTHDHHDPIPDFRIRE